MIEKESHKSPKASYMRKLSEERNKIYLCVIFPRIYCFMLGLWALADTYDQIIRMMHLHFFCHPQTLVHNIRDKIPFLWREGCCIIL